MHWGQWANNLQLWILVHVITNPEAKLFYAFTKSDLYTKE